VAYHSPEGPLSPAASSRLHPAIAKLNDRLPSLSNLDFARWGAMFIEDIGVVDIDTVIVSGNDLGHRIRQELTGGTGRLNQKWTEFSARMIRLAPVLNQTSELLSVLCISATAHLLIEDRINGTKAD
jgi:hypothetical protein